MAELKYDLVVIGGGPAGLSAAKFAVGVGKKVLLIEQNKLGGGRAWTGCVSTKTLIKTAQVAHTARTLKKYGLSYIGSATLETGGVLNHVRGVALEVYDSYTPEKIVALGIDLKRGSPQFIDTKTIGLDDLIIQSNRFIIATGSSSYIPSIPGLETIPYLTSETFFDLEVLPSSLLIIGGGSTGVEFASALNRLGVRVTLVEAMPRILSNEDAQAAQIVAQVMQQEGVDLRTGLQVHKIEQGDDGVVLYCRDNFDQEVRLFGEQLLMATGRRANCDGLGLEHLGIIKDRHGIHVDQYLQSSIATIFAAGDVAGPYLYTHIASEQGALAARNALLPFRKKMSYEHTCWVIFSAPELARAGLTELAARDKFGDKIQIYTVPYASIDRAHTDRATEGLCKIICHQNGIILGVHIVGERAGEVMHELQLAKALDHKLEDLSSIIHAYPTYSDLVWQASKKRYFDKLEKSSIVRSLREIFGYKRS